MPNVNPLATNVAPGTVSPSGENSYPQYGVGGGTPGKSGGWNVVTADNEAQKSADIAKGYATWFSSKTAAEEYISSESSTFGSGSPSIPDWSLDASGLKDWFFRGLMVVGGLFLMAVGISKMLNVENKITEVASKIPVVPV
jgi:hypothetical protein